MGFRSILQSEMQKQQKTALVWFRNDLRVKDQQSLYTACSENDRVLGLYCFDPRHYEEGWMGFQKTGKFRARFLLESVKELRKNLDALNITLIVKFDRPEHIIPELLEEFEIQTIYCQKEWTQEENEVLHAIRLKINDQIKIVEQFDQFLYHPADIPLELDNIPRVFTNFRKACEKKASVRRIVELPEPLPEKNKIDIEQKDILLDDLGFQDFETDPRSNFPYHGGEAAARDRVEDYFFSSKKLGVYKKTRNGLSGTDYSSKLSPWLACGCISARQIYWEVKRFETEHFKNQSTYWLIFELIWRDFFKYISLKHGNQIFQIGGILHKKYDWNKSQNDLHAWKEGGTAEPFVNANMIELKNTGWMSNRGRQNVASYLAKDLKIDWRLGAAYFESVLIDYDVHSNYGNWMYVAGVGNDPRDRKFNVKSQAERYDPQGKYQRTWLQKTLFE